MTIIPLGQTLLSGSSDLPEGFARRAGTHPGKPGTPFLFGLAPCGVYRALTITDQAVRSYRTFSPLPRQAGAVCFLWHWPFPASRDPDVIRHTALWSSDFPLTP